MLKIFQTSMIIFKIKLQSVLKTVAPGLFSLYAWAADGSNSIAHRVSATLTSCKPCDSPKI